MKSIVLKGEIMATQKKHIVFGLIAISMFVLFLFGLWSGDFTIPAFSQSESSNQPKPMKQKQDQDNSNDEVQKYIELLSQTPAPSTTEMVEALHKLGSIGDKRAIPILIKNIAFERQFDKKPRVDPSVTDHWDDPKSLAWRFPSITALFQIGETAIPALITVIETKRIDSVESRNALYTIQFIFRDDLSEAIRVFKAAASRASTAEARKSLFDAIGKTRIELSKSPK